MIAEDPEHPDLLQVVNCNPFNAEYVVYSDEGLDFGDPDAFEEELEPYTPPKNRGEPCERDEDCNTNLYCGLYEHDEGEREDKELCAPFLVCGQTDYLAEGVESTGRDIEYRYFVTCSVDSS